MCGAEYPLKVAALGENMSSFGFADDSLRPPAGIGNQPRWPVTRSRQRLVQDFLKETIKATTTNYQQQLTIPRRARRTMRRRQTARSRWPRRARLPEDDVDRRPGYARIARPRLCGGTPIRCANVTPPSSASYSLQSFLALDAAAQPPRLGPAPGNRSARRAGLGEARRRRWPARSSRRSTAGSPSPCSPPPCAGSARVWSRSSRSRPIPAAA